jgi:hypothetical protein
MVNNVSISKALVWLVVLPIIVGAVLGLTLSDSDLLNPTTRSVEAQRISIENQRIARQNEIDLRHDQEKKQEVLRHLQARSELDLELRWVFGYALAAAVIIPSIGASVGLALLLANRGRKPSQADAWTPERRALAVQEAKRREREGRLEQIYLQQCLSQLTQIYAGNDGDGRNGETIGQMPSTITP